MGKKGSKFFPRGSVGRFILRLTVHCELKLIPKLSCYFTLIFFLPAFDGRFECGEQFSVLKILASLLTSHSSTQIIHGNNVRTLEYCDR